MLLAGMKGVVRDVRGEKVEGEGVDGGSILRRGEIKGVLAMCPLLDGAFYRGSDHSSHSWEDRS